LDFLKHQKIAKNFDQTPLYAKTFLNGRWREYIDFKFEAPL
jgi:threonine dehydratase